jgi:Xaa-Pro aminopeptidase
MSARLSALAASLDEPLLVTDLVNILYLTGFDSSNAALLVQPGGGASLYTDFRYIESANEVPDVEVVLAKRSLLVELGGKLKGTVQFEAAALPYSEWQNLTAGSAKLVPTTGVVERFRAVKDADELGAIRAAARIGDRAFEALTAETFVGRTERELSWRLHELAHAHGADDVSFEAIVASGPNGALPHATPTDKIVEPNTLVVVDWGVKAGGYCSDCTRTLSTGSPPARLVEAYEVCLAAQQKACAGIRAGLTGVEADALSRDHIATAGFGEFFGHGLGHGLGLAVHEAPRLSTESSNTLVAGNVVTIEPGIYLAGLGGVRIEDLAIVGEDGVELLTSFPKQLVEVS